MMILDSRPPPNVEEGAIVFGDREPGFIHTLPVDVELIEPFEVVAGGEVFQSIQPQVVFRGQRLCIEPEKSGVLLMSLKISNVENLAAPPVAVEVFRPLPFMPTAARGEVGPDEDEDEDPRMSLHLPTCSIAQRITLHFRNPLDRAVRLRCWLEGIYIASD